MHFHLSCFLPFAHLLGLKAGVEETDLSRTRRATIRRLVTEQSTGGPARYRIAGTLLMLPIGLIAALILVYVLAYRGGYYPGEFLLAFAAIFAVLFLFRVWFWRSRRRYWRQRWDGNEATRILRQRYARGEITQAQFRQMLRDLRQREDSEPGTSPSA